ncbi:hypothetical protein J9303_01825 [Bacillaceae bacterium Marseille-Q3522]|nr:hypothetical protein [Bacillaceae bacterium Marseille-Q3522]
MLKQEKGHSLLVVLLVVTVFSILFLTIMGASIHHAKQITYTEREGQAVSLAEMGIVFYQTIIENEWKVAKAEIEEQLKADLMHQSFSEEALIKAATDKWEEKLAQIPLPEPVIVDSVTKSSYEISNPKIENTNNGLAVTYTSTGIQDTHRLSLDARVRLLIDSVLVETADTPPPENADPDSPVFDDFLMTDPGPLAACPPSRNPSELHYNNIDCELTFQNPVTKKLNINNVTMKISENIIFTTKIEANNAELYLKKDLDTDIESMNNAKMFIGGDAFFHTVNNLNNMFLFTGGAATFQTLNSLNNSKLYLGNGATFYSLQNVNNAKLYVNGNAVFHEDVGNFNNSDLYINGDMEINKNFQLHNNVKACVNGTLKVNGTIRANNNIKIFVRDFIGNQADNVVKIPNPDEFVEYCGLFPLPPDGNGQDIITDVELILEDPAISTQYYTNRKQQ